MMETVIKELDRAIKYRERELESWHKKLELMREQILQYEQELIPKYEDEIEELKLAKAQLEPTEENPFK